MTLDIGTSNTHLECPPGSALFKTWLQLHSNSLHLSLFHLLCEEIEVSLCCPLLVPPAEDLRLNAAVFKWPDSLLAVMDQSKISLASCSRRAEDHVSER